jgi:alkylation response protein AidB-like acyl-CoA dehydrogenase
MRAPTQEGKRPGSVETGLYRVTIGRGEPGRLTRWVLNQHPSSVDEMLARAPELVGMTSAADALDTWEALATLAASDLALARALEPHLDAMSILTQAGMATALPAWSDGSWGVFAAEGGDDPLQAREQDSGWRLTGTKPWCSLAGRLDFALITAHLAGGGRALFAIDLRDNGVRVTTGEWHARGLAEIVSSSIQLAEVPGIPVGGAGWYLERPGFDVGGIGVAACWYGGALAIARTLFASDDAEGGVINAMHLGAVDVAIGNARLALADAGERVAGGVDATRAKLLAKRVRGTVARTVEEVLWRAAHALGPAPLAQDEAHAKRVADLELYVRQHHAEKDEESLGRLLRHAGGVPW